MMRFSRVSAPLRAAQHARGLRIQGSSIAMADDHLNLAGDSIKEQLLEVGINCSRPIPTIFYNLTVPELYEAATSFRARFGAAHRCVRYPIARHEGSARRDDLP